ncbi:MAG: ABC transporter ATP-binding protein [Candidatus Eremiobacteraeota bacterium]|nr:ABC transporter ATP-binding protein [Candidatus Eremiobacteraeota bacterium]
MKTISVKNLSKRYRNIQAIDSLTFEVDRGEIFGFLGPNGAGKTTTIKILTTQIRPDEGEASILGHDVVKESDKAREKIGVVFEEQNIYPRLSVFRNLMFFAGLYGKNRESVEKALDFVKLSHRAKDDAGKLSRGLKQRLLIARALLNDPDIIFLDEPTVGLDPHIARDIRSIFKTLGEQGKTIFLTTHYMEEADELCRRVAIINDGKIVKLDTPSNLKDSIGETKLKIKILDPSGKIEKEESFAPDSLEGARLIEELIRSKKPYKLDVNRVTLEDVFIHYSGVNLD